MSSPKTAAVLDEVDALRMENLQLKVQFATHELQIFVQGLANKYTVPGETIQLAADGSIQRTPVTPE